MTGPETLIHYSDRPLVQIESREQEPPISCHCKPRGLWVSVQGEDDWPEWCESAGFNRERLALAHRIVLHPEARILRVRTSRGIDRITKVYGIETALSIMGRKGIDWPRIATRYAGIVIAPYIWSRRMGLEASWYYTWDCASGCIWDADAVVSVEECDLSVK